MFVNGLTYVTLWIPNKERPFLVITIRQKDFPSFPPRQIPMKPPAFNNQETG